MEIFDQKIDLTLYSIILLSTLTILKIIFSLLSYFLNENEILSKIGNVCMAIAGVFYILLLIWGCVIYPIFFYSTDGNISKALIVILVLSVSIYFLFILIASFISLKDWSGRLNVHSKIIKLRKRYVVVFRFSLVTISLWCLFAARDLTVLLYHDPRFKLINFLEGSEIQVNDSLSLSVIPGTLFFAIIVAIILFVFSYIIADDKPFLKIVRFWKLIHHLDD